MRPTPLPLLLLLAACKPLGPAEYGAVSLCLDGSEAPPETLSVTGTIEGPDTLPAAHTGCDEEPASSVVIRDERHALWRLGIDTRGELPVPGPDFAVGDAVDLYVHSSGAASVIGEAGHLAVDAPLGTGLPTTHTGGLQVALGTPHGGWRRDDCGSVRARRLVFRTSRDEVAVKVGESGELRLDDGAPLRVANAATYARSAGSLCVDWDPPFGWYAWR